MQKTIHNRYLRNPLFIIASFIILLLPEFAYLCAATLPFDIFWSDFANCSQEFTFQAFIGKSIWSLFIVVIVFELFLISANLLRLNFLPDKATDWLFFQLKLLCVLIVAFLVYEGLTYVLEWVTYERIKFLQVTTNPASNFGKILLMGFLSINISLLLQFVHFKNDPASANINVQDSMGEKSIPLSEIKWFEKKGRNYFACTNEKEFRINFNLQTLEKRLSKNQFVRINRAVIANLSAIQDYSYWENEKYILRLQNKAEFVVTRKRILELKNKLMDKINQQV